MRPKQVVSLDTKSYKQKSKFKSYLISNIACCSTTVSTKCQGLVIAMLQANLRDPEGKNAQSLRQGDGVNTGTLSADSAILD